MVPSGGLGPWFCALLVKTLQDRRSKRQSKLVLHTLPHMVADWLNSEVSDAARSEGECWVELLRVGPFRRWSEAVQFYSLWCSSARGKMRRVDRGLQLYRQYGQHYQLRAWGQTRDRDFFVERKRRRRRKSSVLYKCAVSMGELRQMVK